jgi:dTDP-glucose 4,6-dehydratase
MKILVTGGSGFIGKNFILKRLNEYNDDIILNIDKLTYASNKEDILDSRYRHEKIDICDEKSISGIIKDFKPNCIVHFAAESHVDNSIENPSEFINTNIVGTFNLLKNSFEYFKSNDQFRFLHVSTDEVYGSLGKEGKFTEDTPYDPRSPYSAAKASSDHLVRAYFHTYGFPGIITNCSNNYGPYQNKEKFIPKIIDNILVGKKIPVYGKGDNIRDWLYVEDHCDALNLVLEKGKFGETYNIGGDCEMTNIDIVMDITSLITGVDLITFVEDRLGHDFRYAIDHSKITRDLGWKPKTTFEDGIKKTIKWYMDNE